MVTAPERMTTPAPTTIAASTPRAATAVGGVPAGSRSQEAEMQLGHRVTWAGQHRSKGVHPLSRCSNRPQESAISKSVPARSQCSHKREARLHHRNRKCFCRYDLRVQLEVLAHWLVAQRRSGEHQWSAGAALKGLAAAQGQSPTQSIPAGMKMMALWLALPSCSLSGKPVGHHNIACKALSAAQTATQHHRYLSKQL